MVQVMKRITIFKNGTDVDGKVIHVPHSFNELLLTIGKKFNITAKRIFTPDGGEIDDVKLIRDKEILYVSEGGSFEKVVDLSETKQPSGDIRSPSHEWITLNVGGQRFDTTRSTLIMREPNSMLAKIFAENSDCLVPSKKDETGAYLIDRSSLYFELILNYLRTGEVNLEKHRNKRAILEEAQYYCLEGMIPKLEDLIYFGSPSKNESPLSRRDVVKALIRTPSNIELRFRGINLDGADLSRLDLRLINFKYATLRRCRLVGSNLSHCTLDGANLSHSILDGASFLNAKMLYADLSGASLKKCTFGGVNGLKANMQGVIMEGADLEGSKMAEVNLQFANLKNANMKHCDLHCAVLLSADLENSDLTGSNLDRTYLKEANLTGANIRKHDSTFM